MTTKLLVPAISHPHNALYHPRNVPWPSKSSDKRKFTMFQKPALSSLKGLMVTNSVQLYPKESCSCPSLATCNHILAVQMSIRVEELSEKRIYNLTQLQKNTRKRPNKRAGRKQPRPCDRDISIIPAPDSTLQTSFMCSTPQTDKSPQSPAPRTPTTPRSILKRKPSHSTTPVSQKKIKFESPDN